MGKHIENDTGREEERKEEREGGKERERKRERGRDLSQTLTQMCRQTPLHIAAKEGHYDCAQRLINAGADVSARNVCECVRARVCVNVCVCA